MTAGELPRWEHGYRCHGLWRGADCIGFVGIGPLGLWDGTYGWEAELGGKAVEGRAGSLKKAKRAVELALGLPRCPVGR